MRRDTKGSLRFTPFSEEDCPKDADFYDPKFGWYVKLNDATTKTTWSWWSWLSREWVEISCHAEMPTFDRSFSLIKNPDVSWKSICDRAVDNRQYRALHERVIRHRPRITFARTKSGTIRTITKYFNWPQRLYLCWFRGFRRDPDADGFSFIKMKNEQG